MASGYAPGRVRATTFVERTLRVTGIRFWIALCALVALAAQATSAEEPVRILILPIVVHSAASDSSHVSGGLSDMISSRLEQTGRVFVERPEDPALATTQLGIALREGQERKADFVVFGAFTQFGDGASLDVHCIPANVASEAEAAAARRIFIQSGAVGNIIPKLDEIADRLAAYVDSVRSGAGEAVAVDPSAPAQPAQPATVAPGAPAASESTALRAIADRLEALEEAVFGGDTSAAAQLSEPPPES